MTKSAKSGRKAKPEPIPLSLLTGFLGSGKTTLLNRLLADPELADTAVLINEVGEIGLDHLLVEHVADGVVLLSSGCLCCSVRGELVDSLETLLKARDNGRIPPFRRALIETTGLADPVPVVNTVAAHPYLAMRFRLDGIVATVDAVNGFDTLAKHREAVRQVALADRILLTKTDLVDTGAARAALARLKTEIAALAPNAEILDAATATIGPDLVFGLGAPRLDDKLPDVAAWLREDAAHGHESRASAHAPGIHSFVIASEQAIPARAFAMFLELLAATAGPMMLRAKGLVKLAEHPDRPLLLHAVQHIVHPTTLLPEWPDGDRRTRLVFVVDGLPEAQVRGLYNAFAGIPAVDAPDAAALSDNPLALPRGG